jgi:hypothetical protein
VQVHHELAERPFETGDGTAKDHEARARKPCGGFEIHEAEGLPDLEMLLRLSEVTRVAVTMPLDIATLVRPNRDIAFGQVRDDGERVLEVLLGLAFRLFERRSPLFQVRDLGLEFLRPGRILGAQGLADGLGERVAALLRGLRGGDCPAAAFIERDKLRRRRLQPAVSEALVERRGVLADEADVVHRRIPAGRVENRPAVRRLP